MSAEASPLFAFVLTCASVSVGVLFVAQLQFAVKAVRARVQSRNRDR
jgi:hypothetical protein